MPLAALAQTAETGDGSARGPARRERPVTRVLVLGDAIGGGLGAGLTRVAEADRRL